MFWRASGPPKGVEPLPRVSRLASPSQVPVERLRLTVLRRLNGLLAGDHAGLFPGHGTERGEARPYVPGDDPRHLDWAVTARTQEPHVRDMVADHELDVWLILDSSSSLAFGTALASKHELAWSVAGALALLASDGGNRVGAVRSTNQPGRTRPLAMPARGGSAHVGAVLAALNKAPEEGETGDLGGAIDLVNRTAKRRGMAVVISDFLGPATWETPLRALSRRHEVIAVEVIDPREMDLPDVGLIAVVDPETGRRRLLDTSRDDIRRKYSEVGERRREEVSARFKACAVDHLVVRTDRDWVVDFVRFVSGRKARLVAAGRPGR
ncbi:MAG TPA: DUF58 domain-containing protein [Acidimicrobiia bacterium]|nr:DUF58 domain-containing protein [Acidimicrobiia bacterium]